MTKSPLGNRRNDEIQVWIGKFGSNIKNAYDVNGPAMVQLHAGRGSIERMIWKVAKNQPALKLDTNVMLHLLSPQVLIENLKAMAGTQPGQAGDPQNNFKKARRRLIASAVPEKAENRELTILGIERWFSRMLPQLRDSKAIEGAAKLRYEAKKDFTITPVPKGATSAMLKSLHSNCPGRVYRDKLRKKDYLILIPGEKALMSSADDKLIIL